VNARIGECEEEHTNEKGEGGVMSHCRNVLSEGNMEKSRLSVWISILLPTLAIYLENSSIE
jgi:hypothetical protein